MLKLLEFPGVDPSGNALVYPLFQDNGLTKVASGALDPQIEAFTRTIRPSPNKLYVLVNAMGAGEFYGANVNGDYFEEKQLRPDPSEPFADEFGYKTFLTAGVYRHHVNKDKERSYGDVVCAVYNELMHRVELILCLDRAKAKEFGHGQVIEDLDAGKNPAVSMGCRVKYDVCSICGHKSPTRSDYCTHTVSMMNQVMPDGRKVFVYNPRPRFFDISFVLIPADRTGYAMLKVARARGARLSADAAIEAGMHTEPGPGEKRSYQQKLSKIVKVVPAMSANVMPTVTSGEPDLPERILHRMSGMPLGRALSTTAAAGIVLSPEEYQRVVLMRMGRSGLADDLQRHNCCFSPTDAVDRSVGLGPEQGTSSSLLQELGSMLSARSAFTPQLVKRVYVVKLGSVVAPTVSRRVPNDEVLGLVAAGYNGYRELLLEKAGSMVANVTSRDVRLLEALDVANVGDMFVDEQMLKTAASTAAGIALLGAIPLAYLYGARTSGRPGTGDTGPMERFLAKHPVIAASVFVGLTRLGATLHSRGLLNKGLLAKLGA